MKKCILFFFLIAVAVLSIPGEPKQNFDASVDFSVTFRDFFDGTIKGESFDTDKLIIIDGTITAMLVLNEEEGSFVAELELVNGTWKGLEDVEIYKCIVVLKGEDFFKRIPVKRSRKKLPNEIELNTRVLIVGEVMPARKNQEGANIPVIEAMYVRPL